MKFVTELPTSTWAGQPLAFWRKPLEDNPGKWGLVFEGKKYNSVASAYNIRYKKEGFTFRQVRRESGLYDIYATFEKVTK